MPSAASDVQLSSPPDPGQLVEVRQRRWVVSAILKSQLSEPGLTPAAGAQTLVSLNSVDDDALGEELQVVWELEPGARVIEKLALPEPNGFDPPERLAAFLDAVRWGASSSADMKSLQAPFRAGIDVQDYQLDPLVRAIQMPRANLLIADDVGLGKTVEAGLVAQEFIIRHRVRRIIVVCPASLLVQWRDQMWDKFGLEFRIVDSTLLRELRRARGIHANPWVHFPRLITSIDFLKRDRPLQLFREALPAEGEAVYPRRFDLMIVDEAHNVAPAGSGKYARDSQRTSAIRLLTPHFEHRLFLTATPHNGYPESFTALLELLDNQRFARGVRPAKEQLAAVMVRRLKDEIVEFDGKPRFPKRQIEAISVSYKDDERNVHRLLTQYTKLRLENDADDAESLAAQFVMKLLKKRLFSSPAAFLATLQKHEQTLRTHQKAVRQRPSRKILEEHIEKIEDDYADDTELEKATDEAVDVASRLFREPTKEERDVLKKMMDWARTARAVPDSKAQALLSWLHEHIKPGGKWSNNRVIIFTEYRATQKWLLDMLSTEKFVEGERLQMLFGGMDTDKREAVKAAFQSGPQQSDVRILLATDAASEGIDLQNHCHRVIHYEIPWNPNRMEQRNGRIDRYGQKQNPLILHFVAEGYEKRRYLETKPGELEADLEFLFRASVKVSQIREDLGKVGPVIACQVEEAMLGRRTQLDTNDVEKDAEPARKMLKFERDLKAQILRLKEQVDQSRRDLHISPQNVEKVVQTALELADQPHLQTRKIPGEFTLPALRGSWTVCCTGLEHPHTHAIRPITFDPDISKGRDDIVLVHLNHRLVQMAMRILRAEVWKQSSGLKRISAQTVPNDVLDTPAIIAHARLLIIGGDSHRLHEELITVGGFIRDGRFQRMNVGQVETVLGAIQPQQPGAEMQKRLLALYPKMLDPLLVALEVRKTELLSGLQRKLIDRAAKEADDIRFILTELKKAIEKELDAPEYEPFLPGLSDPERDEFERNKQSLRRRVQEIPSEIEREAAEVARRFSDPQPRVFPVAVTFLVPQKLAKG